MSYLTTWPPCVASEMALTTAGTHMSTNAMTGMILALAPRPMPNADRRLCQPSARMMAARPSRGPS